MITPTAHGPSGPVVVVAEHWDGILSPLTRELAVCARSMAEVWGLEVRVVVLGEDAEAIAQGAARITGENAAAVRAPGLSGFHGEAYVKILAELVHAWGARVVVGGHTTSGMDWAPALAVDLGAAYLAGTEALEHDADGLLLLRAGLFGKMREIVRPLAGPWCSRFRLEPSPPRRKARHAPDQWNRWKLMLPRAAPRW
jgi:electron transfer flavoprotein alpha subunit